MSDTRRIVSRVARSMTSTFEPTAYDTTARFPSSETRTPRGSRSRSRAHLPGQRARVVRRECVTPSGGNDQRRFVRRSRETKRLARRRGARDDSQRVVVDARAFDGYDLSSLAERGEETTPLGEKKLRGCASHVERRDLLKSLGVG